MQGRPGLSIEEQQEMYELITEILYYSSFNSFEKFSFSEYSNYYPEDNFSFYDYLDNPELYRDMFIVTAMNDYLEYTERVQLISREMYLQKVEYLLIFEDISKHSFYYSDLPIGMYDIKSIEEIEALIGPSLTEEEVNIQLILLI